MIKINFLKNLQLKIQKKPVKYSLLISFLIALFTPTFSIICWEGCSGVYGSNLNFLFSEMALGIIPGIISIILKIFILSIPIYFIFKNNKISNIFKLFLIVLVIISIITIQSSIYYNFTKNGIGEKSLKNNVDLISKDLKSLKTKKEIINYIKSKKNYTNVICENTEFKRGFNSFLSDLNIYEENKNYSELGRKLYLDRELNPILNSVLPALSRNLGENISFNPFVLKKNILKSINKSIYNENLKKNILKKVSKFLDEYDFTKVNLLNITNIRKTEIDIKTNLANIVYYEEGKKDYALKYENSYSSNFVKSFFCEVKIKIGVDYLKDSNIANKNLYYDCIYYFNNNLINNICFRNNKTTFIYVNSNQLSYETNKEFIDSYFNKKLIIKKSYMSSE